MREFLTAINVENLIRWLTGGFPKEITFKFGIYIEKFTKWLMLNYGNIFDNISDGILWFMLRIENLLNWLPWWFLIGLVFVLGWRFYKLRNGIIFAVLFSLVGVFGLWSLMMSTLAIVITAVILSLLIGIPVGILAASSGKIDMIIKPILDAMQTMPSFVYLIPAMMLFGLGMVPAVFATIIYAIPPVIRLTNLGIRNVPQDMVEAAHSFGSSRIQTLFKVQLPQALPSIMTGVNQTTMMAISMVVTASMVGAKGLGMEVLQAIGQINIARGFDAGLSIVIMAVIIDRIIQGLVNKTQVPQ